ncbi:FG-GAP repeat domain-containing protein [Glycomyces salinus]|uniref:FG-GAP repeat domain-containing protein n=1 Tax=Glycomyces salinus TaxID=980294 RepID=UPI0018EB9C8B|nr:VCBS repeat-containing protein [Glycomyces salinus]
MRIGVRSLVTVVLAAIGLVGASVPAAAQSCEGGAESDFDGDGQADLMIADPDATVGSAARSGMVHIAYGDGATQTITQADVPDNDAAAGDRFGYAVDSTDWNGDGCADLFIGVPFEDWSHNTLADAGLVIFIPGSPGGLDTTAAKNWSQNSFGTGSGAEPGDRFGWSLAAGTQSGGTPFLVVGAPGEGIGGGGSPADGSGLVIYATPDDAVHFHQESDGVVGIVEPGDLYGYSVTGSESGFAVGAPGEAIGSVDYAGTVHLFSHSDGSSLPDQIEAWDQSTPGISGVVETGDMYGASVEMVDYISTTGGDPRMMLAIGTPGEAIGSDMTAGLSSVVWSSGSGITEYRNITQNGDGNADDTSEPGDAFGAAVAMVNRTPDQNTSTDTLLLAVGSPGEDADGVHDVGEVGLFSMTEEVSEGGDAVRPVLEGAGLNPVEGGRIGSVVHATTTHLFVTVADEASPAVYGVPWDNIVADGTDPVLTYTPADFGLDVADVASFGAVLA